MEKRNISFTKDGMKVGVKDMSEEEYTSKQQRYRTPPSVNPIRRE